ncbi:MAG: dipeptide/oligopeptide/nickel ABC transporter ATP-binding protein [Actinobacteria bacterium RBG_19FT_COMBO_36_27]|nr:MAG: dipeptide/oligopeptide/nickel ABC transporter ATP-binding protein [Actinobacteria bacterium RBG_19FT_COMBO_36_27]
MNKREIIMQGNNLTRIFGYGKGKIIAVNNVSFEFKEREVVSIIGESGSGKTTLARILLGLLKPTRGDFLFKGEKVNISSFKKRRAYWQNVQAIFQDPFSSFNQFYRVEKVLQDCLNLKGLKLSREERYSRMQDACRFVNMEFDELYNKYPFELSGGQMQRLMIARIFMLNPNLLIADEPTTMIDACSRSTIMEMLLKLRDKNNMTVLFITHDLGLAYYISDTIYIMKHGRIIESGKAKSIITNPQNPDTKKLLDDVPKLHEEWNL